MIKILTLLGNNYGGCLQAVALQRVIKDLGEDVETINYREYLNSKKNIKELLKQIVYYNRNIKFNNFRKNHLLLSKQVIKIEDDEKSKYIVGSDQVWNPNILYSIRKNFFLNFVKDKNRKFSYAASVGSEILDEENEDKIVSMLNDFKLISIREKSSKKLLKKVKTPIFEALDPTLLLSKDEWDVYKDKSYSKNDYTLVYMLGVTNDIINGINNNIIDNIMEISYKKHFKKTKYLQNGFGPSEFISAIDNSNCVITNSFHGMVFSIIYHKDFFVVLRDSMNSRIYDLLDNLGLTDRIINMNNENKININNHIDYREVDQKLNNLKEDNINFIKKIIREK